ncbi:hypothetical protein FOZ63_017306, partial [Perkinsus olseni]
DISRLELFAIVLGLLIVGEIQGESEGECTILSDNTAVIHVLLWASYRYILRLVRRRSSLGLEWSSTCALRQPTAVYIWVVCWCWFPGLSMDPRIAGKVAQML